MSVELRQQGNDLYRSHSYHEALRCYLRALQCDDVSEADKAKIHNNLAACYLKLKKYQDVITNSTLCLAISPKDVKALYRRSQAYQALGEVEKSYHDAIEVKKIDPKNEGLEHIFNLLREDFQNTQGAYCEMDMYVPDVPWVESLNNLLCTMSGVLEQLEEMWQTPWTFFIWLFANFCQFVKWNLKNVIFLYKRYLTNNVVI